LARSAQHKSNLSVQIQQLTTKQNEELSVANKNHVNEVEKVLALNTAAMAKHNLKVSEKFVWLTPHNKPN